MLLQRSGLQDAGRGLGSSFGQTPFNPFSRESAPAVGMGSGPGAAADAAGRFASLKQAVNRMMGKSGGLDIDLRATASAASRQLSHEALRPGRLAYIHCTEFLSPVPVPYLRKDIRCSTVLEQY
jgi:hypothetical protein